MSQVPIFQPTVQASMDPRLTSALMKMFGLTSKEQDQADRDLDQRDRGLNIADKRTDQELEIAKLVESGLNTRQNNDQNFNTPMRDAQVGLTTENARRAGSEADLIQQQVKLGQQLTPEQGGELDPEAAKRIEDDRKMALLADQLKQDINQDVGLDDRIMSYLRGVGQAFVGAPDNIDATMSSSPIAALFRSPNEQRAFQNLTQINTLQDQINRGGRVEINDELLTQLLSDPQFVDVLQTGDLGQAELRDLVLNLVKGGVQ